MVRLVNRKILLHQKPELEFIRLVQDGGWSASGSLSDGVDSFWGTKWPLKHRAVPCLRN